MNKILLFLGVSAALIFAARASAQTWDEIADGGGDAGELLGDAQVPTGSGPLTTITGSRDGDADMFLIRIVDTASFEAKTWPDSDPDTQLFLFDLDGNGVTFNDDDEGLLSRITGQFLLCPGDYYIALSSFDYDAESGGQEIWEDTPFGVEREPDGPGAPGPVDGWSGAGAGGAYQIDLIGVEFVGAPILGACCLPDGSCTGEVPIGECCAAGGRFAADTLCADLDPPCAEQTGRCCIFGDNPECLVVTATECGNLDGDFGGFGLDCEGDPCDFVTDSCCLPGDSCTDDVPEAECRDIGGRFARDTFCEDLDPPCEEQTSPTWDEAADGGGDAGELPGDAQIPTGIGSLTTITGARDGDADMYLIRIVDDANFEAKTWPDSDPDTQLFLFDLDGNGITFNDDDDPNGLLSRITGQFLPGPGDYYIALSSYDYDAMSAGQEIWIDTPFGEEREPDGPGAPGPVDGWGGDALTEGVYQIDLVGVEFVGPPEFGACCIADGSCTDDVPSGECRDAGGRFAADTLCADLDPACEEQTGGCCIEAGGGCQQSCERECDGDVDCDGFVNPVDLGLCLAVMGSDDPQDLCDFDMDCDGFINPVDCGLIQTLFGTCDEPRGTCDDGGGGAECVVVTGTECRDRGGSFLGYDTDCENDPCGFAEGACCLDLNCSGTTRRAECDDRGGAWYAGQTCPEFSCPDVVACGWDNSMIPDGFSGRAISPPNFPDIRVVDDIVAEGAGCTVLNFHANVIEDAGWTDDGIITVFIYEDTGSGPGALIASVDSEYERMATGDNYFGRDDFDYWVEGITLDLPAGTSWIGIRNAGGGGSGTNYWMTSDGGSDGPGSDTGWFSLDGGNSFQPEGAGWHHAFEVVP